MVRRSTRCRFGGLAACKLQELAKDADLTSFLDSYHGSDLIARVCRPDRSQARFLQANQPFILLLLEISRQNKLVRTQLLAFFSEALGKISFDDHDWAMIFQSGFGFGLFTRLVRLEQSQGKSSAASYLCHLVKLAPTKFMTLDLQDKAVAEKRVFSFMRSLFHVIAVSPDIHWANFIEDILEGATAALR